MNYLFLGALVGFLTGLTGIGGGSLLTPLMILWLGIQPATAVGTDLLFNALTKISAALFFQQKKYIQWQYVRQLLLGSVPAVLLMLLALKYTAFSTHVAQGWLRQLVGYVVLLFALLMLCSQIIKILHIRYGMQNLVSYSPRIWQMRLTGATVGFITALTSIGSGLLGTLALFLLNPAWPPVRILATELVHAIPISLLAGLGYLSQGQVNLNLLSGLLLGSVPGTLLGSVLADKLPNNSLRFILIFFLCYISLRLILAH